MAAIRYCPHAKRQVMLRSQGRPAGEWTGYSCFSTYCLADMARWVREESFTEPLIQLAPPTHERET